MDVNLDDRWDEVACPLCKRRVFHTNTRLLYSVPVCKRCSNRFSRRRQWAFAIDATIWETGWEILRLTAGFFLAKQVGLQSTLEIIDGTFMGWIMPWLVLPLVFAFKDGFNGMSLGKRLVGLQVVDETTREPISFAQSFRRNLVLLIPIASLIIATQLRRGPRWGDPSAQTAVIWKKYRHAPPFDPRGIPWCNACGYNLTGNTTGRCPECGQTIPIRRARPIARPILQPAPEPVTI